MIDRRRFLAVTSAFAAMRPGATASAEDKFPSHNVRLIVPFTAGGPTDVIARIISDAMATKWSVPVIVENRPGAGTLLGTDVVAKSAPDGHTIGMVITAYVINPAVRSSRETIAVAPADDGVWWFWWSRGDRIARVTDVETAAFKVAYVLIPQATD